MEPEEEIDKRNEAHRPWTRLDMAEEFPVESTMPSIADQPRQQLPAACRDIHPTFAQKRSRETDHASSPSHSSQGVNDIMNQHEMLRVCSRSI